MLAGLLGRATATEQEFLVKLVIGELRQGALEGVVIEAVARAFDTEARAVRKAVMLAGGLPPVAAALAEAGRAGLDRFELSLFRPVQPMLADTADDVEAALERLGEAAFEYKLDGARVHVHKDGDQVEVFTRAAEPGHRRGARDRRSGWPPCRRAVWCWTARPSRCRPTGRPLPFQQTMRRFGRKLDLAALRAAAAPVGVFLRRACASTTTP